MRNRVARPVFEISMPEGFVHALIPCRQESFSCARDFFIKSTVASVTLFVIEQTVASFLRITNGSRDLWNHEDRGSFPEVL